MPKVQSYRKGAGSGALQPVRAGTDMSLASQEAVIRSGLPDGTAARAQRDMSMTGVQRGRQAAELMVAGAKLNLTGGREAARVADMSARAERLAMDSSAQILTAMGARFIKMQEDHDAAEVMAAANEWHGYVSQYFNDPEKGMKATRQLANAKGLYDDTSKYLDVVTERCAQNLRTPQQRQAFLKSVAGSRLSAEEKASVYEAQEMGKYAKQTTQQTVQSAIASVAEDPTQTNFNANFERARDAVLFYMRGADEESQRVAVEGLRSDFHAGIIENRMQSDPITAEQYFEQVKGEILPEVRVKLEENVRKAALEAHLQEDTPKLFEEYGFDGLADARTYIRDNYSGDEEEKRISAAESYWREMQQDRNAREAKAYDDIIGMMEDGASAHQVKEAINSFGWSTRLAKRQVEDEYMRHYHIGNYAPSASDTVHTDRNTLLALWELQDSGALLDVAPDFSAFKAQFGDRLSTTDLRTYRTYYGDLEKGVAKQNVAIKMNYGSAFRKMIEKEGINDEKKTAYFLDRFNTDYDAMVRDAKGRPVTNEMAVTLMQDILAPEVVGQKKGPLWFKTDVTVRRGEIPRGAERGADGRWYIADEDGHYRPIIFPGTEDSVGMAEIDWDLPPVM